MKNVIRLIEKVLSKPQWLLLSLGVAFFFLYSWLYLSTPIIFNSPDETATFVFTQQYIQSDNFQIPFSPNPQDLVHPRSVNISGSAFVPGGFLGLPLLLGSLGSIVGEKVIFLLPSLLAVIAILCLYSIWKQIFPEKIALLSTVFLFFLPQWWHYAAKGFLPNSLFVSLLIIGSYAFLKSQETKQLYSMSLCSGIFIGLALAIRPNELWWVAGVFLFLLFYYRKKISWKGVGIWLIGFFFPLLAVMQVQSQTFGGVATTGYDQLHQSGESVSFLTQVMKSFFPFGVDLIGGSRTVFQFVFQLFWWQIVLAAIGLIAWWKNPEKSNEQKIYTVVFCCISVHLFLYYGSWVIADDLDANRISIGISYIRYWLPFFLLLIPFILLGIDAISQWWGKKKKIIAAILFFLLIVGQSLFVLEGKDGLRKIQQTIVEYKEIRQEVTTLTEGNAVIVGERIDKIIWPAREVIHFQDQDYSFVQNLPEVLDHYPVYWLTLLPNSHVQIWEEREFSLYDLQLEYVQPIGNKLKLYRIEHANNE